MAKDETTLGEVEANRLYLATRNTDPFPNIKPALLNSADIINYVEKTAMINPFNISEDFIKPASYSLRVKGKYKYWDSNEKETEGSLNEEGDHFILKRNTVAFVTIESKLRLPHYIAARFNLQIKHVHRGILLGTGPLVDPGFVGSLFIPLHNLTNNDYKIEFLEPLIWMEFTKISDSEEFVKDMADTVKGKFYPFKGSSSNIDPYSYLVKASPHAPILNSLSSLISKAEALQAKTEKIVRGINVFASLVVITLFIGLGTYLYNISSIRKESFDYVNSSSEKIQNLQYNIDSLKKANLIIQSKEYLQDTTEKNNKDRVLHLNNRINSIIKKNSLKE